jgi:hypothetical protein
MVAIHIFEVKTTLSHNVGPGNYELHKLYASPNIVKVIKSRRMRLAGHAARMGTIRNAYSILVVKPEGKRSLA